MTVDADTEFRLLHTLRIKGTATMEELSSRHDGADLEPALARHIESGHAMEAAGRYALTEDGRAAHESTLRERVAGEARAAVGGDYEGEFLPLNLRFKGLCAEWQQTEDVELIEQLDDVHAELTSFLETVAARVDHLGSYAPRFEAALDRVLDGDAEALTGPVGESYHNIWFELHEDLLVTLGRDRADEEA